MALGFAERRSTFAIATALGARPRQLAAFVLSEAVFVTVGGALVGSLAGWAIAYARVKILTGVFDPPPEHLFVPWAYLAVLGSVTLTGVLATILGASTRRDDGRSAGHLRDL
jgi:putative ABC transport system permease protein